MMLKFPLFARGGRARGAGVQSGDFVVARPVSTAPSAWVFFDGTVTHGHGSGRAALSLPGIAFFIDEAWSCPDLREAQAQAARLNAQASGDGQGNDRGGEASAPWIAIAVRKVIATLPGLPPGTGPRNRGGLPG